MIARTNYKLSIRIIEGKCEHPIKAIYSVFTIFDKPVNQYLSVRLGLKVITLCFEHLPKIFEVVNFSIEDQKVLTTRRLKWLIASTM